MKSVAKILIGVDISSKNLDVNIYPLNKKLRVQNSESGVRKILKIATHYNAEKIVCEASGGYEFTLANIVLEDGKHILDIVNPRNVRRFAESMAFKAKTDTIDAKMIAFFADTFGTRGISHCKVKKNLKLREFLKRKSELVEMIAKEKTKLKNPRYYHTHNLSRELIAIFEEKKKNLEQGINEIMCKEEQLLEKKAIMETIPGVGHETAVALLAEMPELGKMTNKEAASLLGVCPFTKESGNYKGHAKTRYGRFFPRRAVYMAALTATRFNPTFKLFYERLRKKGKPAKVAIIAVARKIIITINQMLIHRKEWCTQLN